MGVSETVPAGFERHFRQSPATDPWEPLWSRRDDGFTIGLHVREAHCNARGLLHGGVLSALADNAMGIACADRADGAKGLLTAHLSVDYLGSARVGQWIEVRARPRRVGGSIAYAEADVLADGEAVASASAIFKIVRTADG
ncbi:PaaI family thioesterase [Sphingomonas corticis]|uniref:PaaI family thioesterase n=1 Tax=Sphingomonas corticis TaxID=2722791 RepID=A0ABX1CU20_9SPHN|nr:PaaI family thioesterase [Sphingomonas corticis]NJR80306.1 PaaI family thioesterase [Sphingomonas corticis]